MNENIRSGSKYNIPVIEDAAEALGLPIKAESVGLWTHVYLSFNGTKLLPLLVEELLVCNTLEHKNKKRLPLYSSQRKCSLIISILKLVTITE